MFDHVSDLHLDSALGGGPHGWLGRIDMGAFKRSESPILIVAGDTSEWVDDTIDVLNNAAQHYAQVVAVLGNHEKVDDITLDDLADNVVILDLIGGARAFGTVGFVGGALVDPDEVDLALANYRAFAADPAVERIILVSHVAPTPRLGAHWNLDIRLKSNDLLDRLGPPVKRTDLVFGHLHLAYEGEVDGVALHANPRGYRGLRRDGSSFSGFATFA